MYIENYTLPQGMRFEGRFLQHLLCLTSQMLWHHQMPRQCYPPAGSSQLSSDAVWHCTQRNLTLEDHTLWGCGCQNKVQSATQHLSPANQEAKINPNIIWQTRRKIKTDTDLEYNTITEERRVLMEPEEMREYIAQYFENPYQARPSTPAYEEWTKKITEKIEMIKDNHTWDMATQGSEPIECRELYKAIKRLKRRKSLGPDQLPNELRIEGDETHGI